MHFAGVGTHPGLARPRPRRGPRRRPRSSHRMRPPAQTRRSGPADKGPRRASPGGGSQLAKR
eukprot:15463910-Alexandrium_andersonii.AAC.1